MKRGDLVKLVLPAAVADDRRGKLTSFPEGTVAVFLAHHADEEAEIASILVEGRVGWVWSRYLEVIDEAG